MSRKPIYALKNETARIISVPNDLWRVQIKVEPKGTRGSDNWHNRSHPIAKSEALVALAAYNKE